MKSKTMILQSQTDNKSGRAILTLTQENDLLTTKLRLYSFAPLDANAKLGVYHNNQVFAGNMLFKDGAYISSLVGDFDINADFYCAVVDTLNNNTPLLAGGTYGGYYFDDTSVITNNLNNCYSPNKITPARETAAKKDQPNRANQQSNTKGQQPCQNQCNDATNANNCGNNEFATNANACTNRNYVDSTNNCGNNEFATNANPCIGCKYKEYFYTQQPQAEPQTNNINNINKQKNVSSNKSNQESQTIKLTTENQTLPTDENQDKDKAPSIIESLIPQFDYIFKTFPECEELNNRIENSRFVTISEGSNTYCLGAIYKDNQPEYICYAVPTAYNAPVPEELGTHHQWLPLDPEDPLSDGYHIVYQDAHDLKIIEV